MSSTVNEAFSNFNKEYVNLDPERTKVARGSRDWLFKQLIGLQDKFSDFPKLYQDMHVNFGSFSRNTKIGELDDIDLMLTFSAEGTTYDTISYGKEYILRPPESATKLRSRCNDDKTLNSIKVVNMLVNALAEVEQYASSEIHRVQEAATLQLNSYEWCYDIVPAFYTDTGYYLIPDGQGRWKATDPRVDHERVTRINSMHGGKLLQVIRTLKYWNRRAMMTTIPPYFFENMILNYFEQAAPISEYIDFALRDFWNYLQTGIHYDVSDPKKFQVNLNTLTHEERRGIAEKAAEAHKKANEAIRIETQDHNQASAIRKWAELFGDDFN